MWAVRAAVVAAAWLWLCLVPGAASAQGDTVLTTRVAESITPIVADHLAAATDAAAADGHQALLVELDTPGGLDTSMRRITQSFLAADVPVIVYVSPAGARAASAGSIITSAAHVAAMAPGTTIGAATPVNLETGEPGSDKVINDAAAYAESVAAQRGRNTEFAVDSVREGRAVTADEAVDIDVVDLAAPDRAALLRSVDGRTVEVAGGRQVTLRTADAGLVTYEMSLARRILQLLADPNLAFLFISIGTLAVIYELATPGAGLGGVIGAILLVLGFAALSVLPVNVAGLVLLALAAALFVAEVFTPGVGVFAGGGAVALLLSGLFLFEGPMRVDPAILWPTVVLIGGGVVVAGRLAWRARRARPASGVEGLVGTDVTVAAVHEGIARVRHGGAWWNARGAGTSLRAGQQARVVGLDGLTFLLEPHDRGTGDHDRGTGDPDARDRAGDGRATDAAPDAPDAGPPPAPRR